MEAAPGVTLVDTSNLDFQESVNAVLDVVATQTGRTGLSVPRPGEDPEKVRDNG